MKKRHPFLKLTPAMVLTEDQKIGLFRDITDSLSLWSFNDVTWKIGRTCNHYRSGHYVGKSVMVSNDPYTFIFAGSDDIGEHGKFGT